MGSGTTADASRVDALVAALGNHEGKALTYLAMERGEEYGITGLHRLFVGIQGDEVVFRGVVTLPQKYCVYSFEPAGLVERTSNEKGHLRHSLAEPVGIAPALAGHVLSVIEEHPASLQQILGKTGARAADLDAGGRRPPARRLAVIRALLAESGPSYAANVARRSGVAELGVASTCRALARAGVVRYETGPTYEMRSRYRLTVPIPMGTRGRVVLRNTVIKYLNGLLAQSPGEVVVTRDQIETHIRGYPQWESAAGLRDQLQLNMVRLVKRGAVEALETYNGRTHSLIEIVPGQRAFLARLVEGIDQIAAGDTAALAAGEAKAREILADPARVRRLLAKGFGSSKQVANPVSREKKKSLVLAALGQRDGVTSADLVARLSPDVNKVLLSGTLAELVQAGLVRGEKQPDGPYKLWYLC